MGLVRKMFIDHSGTGHKWAHNATTVMNIPLFAWLVYAVFTLRGRILTVLSRLSHSLCIWRRHLRLWWLR